MRRTVGLVLGLAGLAFVTGLAAQPASKPAALADQTDSAAARASAIVAKLARTVKTDKLPDEASLKEVLSYLQDQAGVTFVLNELALSNAGPGMQEVALAAGPEDQRVRPPKLAAIRLSRVLTLVTKQIGAAWVVRPDYVEITSPQERLREGVYRDNLTNTDVGEPDTTRADIPLVCLSVKNRPLADVLTELANHYERAILVAPQAGEKARAAVSAEFLNVPFDTTVLMLADMADLKVVLNPGGLGAGPGMVGPGGAGAAMDAEVDRLKREVEELRKQLKERAEPKKP
jgi:hypothetical protein